MTIEVENPVPSAGTCTGNLARVRRYRAAHQRIDYVPSADVLEIIKAYRDKRIDNCLAGVIDYLIRAGHRSMSGHA